jgi:hydrogenase expression/formation protein HypC
MCLAVPGKLVAIDGQVGVLDFQGNQMRASLAMTPEAQVGAWLIVHAGMALQEVSEAEAKQTWQWLAEMDELEHSA